MALSHLSNLVHAISAFLKCIFVNFIQDDTTHEERTIVGEKWANVAEELLLL